MIAVPEKYQGLRSFAFGYGPATLGEITVLASIGSGAKRQVRTVGFDRADRQDGEGARTGGVPRFFPGHCGERLHCYRVILGKVPCVMSS